MEYIIVVEWESSLEFTKEVNGLLQDGWKLQGGVSITYDHDKDINGNAFGTMFAQALVREIA
jgi:hypothetical protein